MTKYSVEISRFAQKQLKKIPINIRENLYYWVKAVETIGMKEVRKISGFHDEPLKGERLGQRSVRLNIAYRIIYEESTAGEITIVGVLEVNKHDY